MAKKQLSESISESIYQSMLAKARKKDRKLSQTERTYGFASPGEAGRGPLLRTIEAALECAIKMCDWQIAAEAMVLLQQAVMLERIAESGRNGVTLNDLIDSKR